MIDAGFWVAFGGAAAVFALLGLLMTAAGMYGLLGRAYLTAFGERAVGTVVGLVADRTSRGRTTPSRTSRRRRRTSTSRSPTPAGVPTR